MMASSRVARDSGVSTISLGLMKVMSVVSSTVSAATMGTRDPMVARAATKKEDSFMVKMMIGKIG